MEETGSQDQPQTISQTPEQAISSATEGRVAVTAEDAARAKAEREGAATRLMDNMEESTETQGQYFVKIGNKTPITETREKPGGLFRKPSQTEETVGYNDDRALILKSPVTHEYSGTQPEDFVVVTTDGIKAIRFYKNSIDNPQTNDDRNNKADYDFLQSLAKGDIQPGPYSGYKTDGVWSWSKNYLAFSGDSETARPRVFVMSEIGKDQADVFQEAVKKSIAMVESPHAQNVEQAKAETESLQSADNLINNLPPRA